MKSSLITVTILVGIVFVIDEAEATIWNPTNNNEKESKIKVLLPLDLDASKSIKVTKGINLSDITEDLNKNYESTSNPENNKEIITSENSHDIETTTAEIVYNSASTSEPENYTTTDKSDGNCPPGQSSFTKQDLIIIINYVTGELNITKHISDIYYGNAIHATDKLSQEWNEFIDKFESRPGHLHHVLQDMKNARLKDIVPHVNKAVGTLHEYPVVKEDFSVLNAKTLISLDKLEKSKKICDINCKLQLLRSSIPFMKTVKVLISDDDNMCSTIPEVIAKIKERLTLFEREEIENISKVIAAKEKFLRETIAESKINLRKAAVSQFGITMFEILNLYDDQYQFLDSLKNFNNESLTSSIRKVNMNINYKLLDLDPKIEKYRNHCLSCNPVQRRRRFAADNLDKPSSGSRSDENETNLLDRLLNIKISEIEKVIQLDVEYIFKKLEETLNDKDLVEKHIAKLKPVQDSVSKRTEGEKQELEQLVKSVPVESREQVQILLVKSQDLLVTINQAIDFLEKNT